MSGYFIKNYDTEVIKNLRIIVMGVCKLWKSGTIHDQMKHICISISSNGLQNLEF